MTAETEMMDPVEAAIKRLDEDTARHNDIREKLTERLQQHLETMDLDGEDSSKLIESKLGIYSTLNSLLTSSETATQRAVTTRLRKKDIENDGAIAEAIMTNVRNLQTKDLAAMRTRLVDRSELDRRVEENCERITEGEKEIGDADWKNPNGDSSSDEGLPSSE